MNRQAKCQSQCPIARATFEIGDRWYLLILRELSMGSRRFDEIAAQTGFSSHLLSVRLKRLEADGVIERRKYQDRPVRYEYYATPKGKELDGVLLQLRAWGAKWGGYPKASKPAVKLVHKVTRAELDPRGPLPSLNGFSFDDYDATLSPAFEAEREERRKAFAVKRGKSA